MRKTLWRFHLWEDTQPNPSRPDQRRRVGEIESDLEETFVFSKREGRRPQLQISKKGSFSTLQEIFVLCRTTNQVNQ